jgi:hypothetical protein
MVPAEEEVMAEADGTDVKLISRRALLRRALGVTAAVSSPALEEALAQKLRGRENESVSLAAAPAAEIASGKPQVSLIIDDGSPVDPLFYEIPGYDSPLVVPLEHVKRVAETLERFELRGKMTLIPMPSCLGRIDQSLKKVPQAHLESFREIIRARIAPRFDITPESLLI